MNCCIDRNPAVQTILILTSLDKTTRGTDGTNGWKFHFFSITKNAFTPIINFKRCITHRATGFTLPGLDTLIHTKWAGEVFVAFR
jgi:hypothetical protein